MEPAAFIECRNLHKSFGDKPVLAGVDLRIDRGETMVILGGSGSGKTVLLKHMNGLMNPESGDVFVEGQEISRLEEEDLRGVRRKVAMVFQSCALFDSLTVAENVAYPLLEHTALAPAEIRERVQEVLSLVDLEGSEELYPAEISGGMKKRAALARALALKPSGLLYDEPTTGLDPIMTHRINRLIRDLQMKLGVTSVVVTHDIQSAFIVAERIAFLQAGRIRFMGTRQEIQRSSDLIVQEFLSGS
ncbi:MAG: ATP-binding cassette domain-containing protein [Deltaproteobacteria bacterium]|nr:ATP-binding cassette domain-containing protein [Deltaproteobacteria bacterium]